MIFVRFLMNFVGTEKVAKQPKIAKQIRLVFEIGRNDCEFHFLM